jgi:GNAT superfamily N-acetyltransferase
MASEAGAGGDGAGGGVNGRADSGSYGAGGTHDGSPRGARAEPGVRVRRIADGDWDAIVALEAAAYTPLGISEGRAPLESKVRASPDTCLALDVGGRTAGYLLALPYPPSAYPELSRGEQTVFRSANLHLHDLVIAADLRGRGLGRRMLGRLTADAARQGFERISLVAVGGSHTFWSAAGFRAHEGAVDSGGYGPDSVYMSLPLRTAGTPTPDEVGGA